MGLKADLHLHTREGEASMAYGARELITRAAGEGFRVVSITNHDSVTFSEELAAYAREQGILLIPGVEATIEGQHVLLYNIDVPLSGIRTFDDLRRLRSPGWLVVAPHPFFPAPFCLRGRLLDEIDLFDAIEFSHFYTRSMNFNRRAVTLARNLGLPLLGTSDSHLARQFGTTYSLLDAELTVTSVLEAIRKGRVQVVSRPLTLRQFAGIAMGLALLSYGELMDRNPSFSWSPFRSLRHALVRCETSRPTGADRRWRSRHSPQTLSRGRRHLTTEIAE